MDNPMISIMAGYLMGLIDQRWWEDLKIEAVQPEEPDSFTIVLGSGLILRVKVSVADEDGVPPGGRHV